MMLTTQLQQEKDVFRLVLEDKVDDLKALLPEDQRDRLDDFQTDLNNATFDLGRRLQNEFNQAQRILDEQDFSFFEDPDRERKKMFAVNHVNQNPLLEDGVRNLMFAVYDDKDPYEVVRDFLIGHTSTGTKVDRVRHLVNDLEWSVTEE